MRTRTREEMTFDDLCPKALIQKPFTVRQAIFDLINSEAPVIPDWLKIAAEKIPLNCWNGQSMVKIFKGVKGSSSGALSTKLLFWDKVSCTLLKQEISNATIIHPDKKRKLSTQEMSRLGSFPDGFNFTDRGSAINRIGNSVPPGLMRAVAVNLRHHLFTGLPLTPYPKTMSYLDILEATWQEHLTPKADNAPTVISTFAGGGGSSLGYSMAGFRELLAVEIDNNAVETFKLNFPHVPVFHGDIGSLSVEECMKLAGLTAPGQLDVFDGSPPCQGFSTAGKRQMTDDRNQLFREYVRLLRGLQPKAFIMENVSGMVKGKMKIIFAEILRELKDSGYEVKAWLLNAKYFYVPQSRERMIFVGVRKDYWNELNADSL